MFSKSRVQIKAKEQVFEAEMADTILSKFMGFRFCSEGKMMFSFTSDTHALIDMMLVPKPIYLYFIDSTKEVIEVQKAEPWSLDPKTWSFYRSEKPYRYLLESFEELNMAEGDQLEFEV